MKKMVMVIAAMVTMLIGINSDISQTEVRKGKTREMVEEFVFGEHTSSVEIGEWKDEIYDDMNGYYEVYVTSDYDNKGENTFRRYVDVYYMSYDSHMDHLDWCLVKEADHCITYVKES